MRSVRVVVVGDAKVGKSCILTRFVRGTFDREMHATIGAAFLTKVMTTDSGAVRLQLWDTGGQEKFRSLASMYYRSSAVAVLVYDVTNPESLDALDEWRAQMSTTAPHDVALVVVGNKIDLVHHRAVPRAAGEDLAKTFGAVYYGETSAQTGEGIEDVFAFIARLDTDQDDVQEKAPLVVTQPGKQTGRCC
jgi:small GTP-binding protein